jgi:predicted Zn finger-like uncharacterized protein
MIISCPSCPQKLRVPEELFGRAVKCPKCGATFEAAASAPAVEGAEAPPDGPTTETPAQVAPTTPGLEDRPRIRPQTGLDEPQARKVRRDAEPSRGTMILTLGVLSIVLPVVGLIPGIIAIAMGRNDQKKIKAGQMDRSGSDITQAGWICGIIGTCLQSIACVGCGLYITMVAMVLGMAAKGNFNPKGGPPGQFQRPVAPMPAPPAIPRPQDKN